MTQKTKEEKEFEKIFKRIKRSLENMRRRI
jgi:hypothetical protein